MGADEQCTFQLRVSAFIHDWQAAAAAGATPESEAAQDLAPRHIEWLRRVPNAMAPSDFRHYVLGVGEMNVSDPRFAANNEGQAGATHVRDALAIYAETALLRTHGDRKNAQTPSRSTRGLRCHAPERSVSEEGVTLRGWSWTG